MDDSLLRDLEYRIYNFAVDTVSFVKYLIKAVQHTEKSNRLMQAAAELNTVYSEVVDVQKDVKQFAQKIQLTKQLAQECLDLLTTIDCSEKYVNDKTNLMIDAAGLVKDLSR